MIDVARGEAGPRERVARRLGAEVERQARPVAVELGERAWPAVLGERQRQVTPADADGVMQLLEPIEVEVLPSPHVAERRDQRLLVDVVRRQRAGDGRD